MLILPYNSHISSSYTFGKNERCTSKQQQQIFSLHFHFPASSLTHFHLQCGVAVSVVSTYINIYLDEEYICCNTAANDDDSAHTYIDCKWMAGGG